MSEKIDPHDVEERAAIRLEGSGLPFAVDRDDLGCVKLWLGSDRAGYSVRALADVDRAITSYADGMEALL